MNAADQLTELYELAGVQCEGALTPPQAARLEELVLSAAELRRRYIVYMQVHAQAERGGQRAVRQGDSGFGIRDSGFPRPRVSRRESRVSSPESPIPSPEPLTGPIVIRTSPDLQPALFTFDSSLGGWLFSYAAATVITGMAILGAWMYKVSQESGADALPRPVATANQPPAPSSKPAPELVGQITGTADCRCADPETEALSRTASVPLGGAYALSSGLMEITYQSGAKVILEGPCTYQVDSPAGGFLSLGRLTARVEKGSGVRGQGSEPSSLSPLPSPLFAVRTPTAVVTDLGTEFGVAVDQEGRTQSHVFVGTVKMVPTDAVGDERRAATLNAGQTAGCQKGQRVTILPAGSAGSGRFVRSLQPESIRITEKFDGPVLGPAFEQVPPGRYAVGHGAAEYRQPPAESGRPARGYIRTIATDFCQRDFVFDAVVHVDINVQNGDTGGSHWVFFGIGDGVPNPRIWGEPKSALALVFAVDEGRAFVRLCRPEPSRHYQKYPDLDNPIVAIATPWMSLGPGRHCFRMTKSGTRVRFEIDAHYTGDFHADFDSPVVDLLDSGALLDASNSRLFVGTGFCDTMGVRFEKLSVEYTKTRPQPPPRSPAKEGSDMH